MHCNLLFISGTFPATLYTQGVDSDSDLDDHVPLRKALQKRNIIESDEDDWTADMNPSVDYLTLSHIQTLSDTSVTDDFLKTLWQKE